MVNLTIRISEEEKKVLEKEAKDVNRTLAGYLRDVVLNRNKK